MPNSNARPRFNAIVKDLKLLKVLFKNKIEGKAPEYLGLIERNFNYKDVDTLIEHFRRPERWKSLMRAHLGDWERLSERLGRVGKKLVVLGAPGGR